jgi:hypothetical protein
VPRTCRRVPAKTKEGKRASGAFRKGKETAVACLPELRGVVAPESNQRRRAE